MGLWGGRGALSKLAGITSVLGREGRESSGRMGFWCVGRGGGKDGWGGGGSEVAGL